MLTGLVTLVELFLPIYAVVCQRPAISLHVYGCPGIHEDGSFDSGKAQFSHSEHYSSMLAVSM